MGLLFPDLKLGLYGVPPSGSNGFWTILGLYISLEFDHKNLETLRLGKIPQEVFIIFDRGHL